MTSETLRERAERLGHAASNDAATLGGEDLHAVVHELHVHQIELELQKEELETQQRQLVESCDRFEQLYELAPVAYLILNKEQIIQNANIAAVELLKRDRATLIGVDMRKLIHRDDEDIWYLYRRSALDESGVNPCEIRLPVPDREVTALVTARTLKHTDGTFQLLVSLTDITVRKTIDRLNAQQAEEIERARKVLLRMLEDERHAQVALRESEARYVDLYDNSPDMMCSVDAATANVIRCNQTLADQLGYNKNEIIGQPVFDLYQADCLDHVAKKVFPRFIRLGHIDNEELQLRRKDGSTIDVILTTTAIRDERGVILEARSVLRDVTLLKQTQAEREAAQRDLAERLQHEKEFIEAELSEAREDLIRSTRMATIGRVAAQVAHELRNPLGSVRNAAFYVRGGLKDDQHELLEMLRLIDDELATADIIVRNLLSAANPPVPNPQFVDLTAQLNKSFARLDGSKRLSLRLNAPSEPLHLTFDLLQCRQLLDNLLCNARDAVGEGGEISVVIDRHPDRYVIRISDSGPGIPVELREAVFEPFFTTKNHGIGLGLSICAQIVGQHGGHIRIGSSSDRGTTVVVELPK